MYKIDLKRFVVAVVLCILISSEALAAVKLSSLPAPPPTAKLRVFVQVITSDASAANRPVFWYVAPAELQESSIREVSKMLQNQGIYDVVSADDLKTVLGNTTISNWEWAANKMALLKGVGKALRADYALLFERSFRVNLQFDMNLINLKTGEAFAVSNYIPTPTLRLMHNDERKQAGSVAVKISYRQLFSAAKNDFMETAVSKGKRPSERMQSSHPATTIQTDALENPMITLPDAAMTTTELSPVSIPRETQPAFEKELNAAISARDKKSEAPRLVVYDFSAAENLQVVGLILTEALREALYQSGGFILVNRENILKIMEELKLQQSGTVDETQAVKMGKWLAANEAVTGNLATLGKTRVLQVKRINIQTMGTITMGSLRCQTGREEELLHQMPQLAQKLAPSAK